MAAKIVKMASLKIKPDADRQDVFKWLAGLSPDVLKDTNVTEFTYVIIRDKGDE